MKKASVPRFIPAPGQAASAAEQKNAARDNRHAGEITADPADGDQAAPHRRTDLVSRLAVNKKDAAAHADPTAAIGGPRELPRIAVNVEMTATHLGTGPVAGLAVYLENPAFHFRADVHSRVAVDDENVRATYRRPAT